MYEFVEEGTWTWDKFAEMVRLRRTVMATGRSISEVADWIDLTLESGADDATVLWCYTNGITLVEEDENGRAYFALNSPRGYSPYSSGGSSRG